MKKFLSVVIAAMITMTCTVFPAFATEATADTASPDTATEVQSIDITKLPDKLVYVGGEDVDWDYDSVSLGDIMNGNMDDAEALRAMELIFNLDLTGIEVVATYTDSTTANVPVEELSAKVTNTLTYGEILDIAIKYEDMLEDENLEFEEYDKILEEYDNEIMATILRDYIVEVDYKGATDTYIVNISDDFDDFDDSSDYELVSYTAPNKTIYDIANEDEVIVEDWSDEYGEYFFYDVNVDTQGMSATIRHKETGEIYTVSEDDIYVSSFGLSYDYDESGKLTPGVYMIEATAFAPDGEGYVDFEFPITIIDSTTVDSSTTSTTPTEDNNTDNNTDKDADKNNATATPDSDNTAIKTGTASSVTTVLSVVLVMTAGIVLFWYKKRVTE